MSAVELPEVHHVRKTADFGGAPRTYVTGYRPSCPSSGDKAKLAWLAATVQLDTGLSFTIRRMPNREFNIVIDGRVSVTYPFPLAWVYLQGVSAGAGREGWW